PGGESGLWLHAMAQHEPVGEQQPDRDRHDADDQEVELAASLVSDRLVPLDLALTLQAFRRELEEPGERDPEGETDDAGDHEPARTPLGHAERWTELRDSLRKRPGCANVHDPPTNDVAAIQFGEQAAAHPLAPGRRWPRRRLQCQGNRATRARLGAAGERCTRNGVANVRFSALNPACGASAFGRLLTFIWVAASDPKRP